MDKNEYLRIANLSYSDYCEYLKNKYGIVPGPYFKGVLTKNTFISKKGLEVHHILENVVPNLSNQYYAVQFPLSFQEPENLLYCDTLEHYLLHIMIMEEISDIKSVTEEMKTIFKNNRSQSVILINKFLSKSRRNYLSKRDGLLASRYKIMGKELFIPGVNGMHFIKKRVIKIIDISNEDLFIELRNRANDAREHLKTLIRQAICNGSLKANNCYSVLQLL